MIKPITFRFDENYALASTQSLKNKDIPEGGAKGTILPSLNAAPKACFEKYVDVCFSRNHWPLSNICLPVGYHRPTNTRLFSWYQRTYS
jgi:hypothetical protein